jgi:pimeloyl-ACP methyl ester carboxylesterase
MNIVLVHGAWHGGWCWRDVAALLLADGHRVITPTLTGLGERSHLLAASTDLATHVRDVVGVIEHEELDEVVLVGHSYGGMPITGAADALPSKIRALVYLDALVPSDGDSVFSLCGVSTDEIPVGLQSTPPPPVDAFGLQGALASWAERRLTPQPILCGTQSIRLTGAWHDVPDKMYVRARGYPFHPFDEGFARAKRSRDWVAMSWNEPHNVMMTNPRRVAALLTDISRK